MKKAYTIALALLLAACFAAPALADGWGEVREATVNLNVRAARDRKAAHAVTLSKGERVRCDFPKDGWVAVFKLDESVRDEKRALGFANVKYLKLVAAPKAAPAPKAAAPAPQAAPAPAQAAPKAAPSASEGEGELKGAVAEAAPAPIKIGVDPGKLPVQISADRMTYDENGKVVSFVGNVVAEHGDLTLWASRLSAYFASKSGKKFSVDSVERIVAEGDVRAKKGKTEGECQKVTYLVDQRLLTMEGDPVLRDGPNSLTGGVINFYVRENRSEVVRGKDKRVRAIFMTPARIKEQ
ncbi:LptA/OstA family protein [Pseudodesulfovibrio sp.]|uniref:LptA/OstA family protein n=1 Tax=Pseudodesulfovibrio sp. TaxID=2035812 RepID=UPI002625B34D|nr:LptA/OstA family protein [Pseudodesulfovibrio sp.]MDD3313601.1 LptA/OstA family protein [Pseudodesulfovibrio sp.]